MENVRTRINVEFIRKDDTDKNIKQQSKSTFNGIHESYENMIVINSSKTRFLWIN